MSQLTITVLGGLGEIGMNCMALETPNEMIIIDCGVLFSDLDAFGVNFAIPRFEEILKRSEKLKAFICTHGHEDHIGAIPFAVKKGLKAPIYGSPFTAALVEDRLAKYGIENHAVVNSFKPGETLSFGDFKVQTIPVNHSIVDATALSIETPIGKIIHTGDFKIDPDPHYGKPMDLDLFKKYGDQGVLLLMSDSTNVERVSDGGSDIDVYQSFEQFFAQAQGLTLISMFASNMGRMGQIFELAHRMNKKVVLSGRTIEKNVTLAEDIGYLEYANQVVIPEGELNRFKRDDVVVVATGSQGEYRSALARIANGDYKNIQLQQGDQVLMSSRHIPGNEKAISRVINKLFQRGAHVYYGGLDKIHVSGHAHRPELEKMLKAVRPQYFIPVHGEYRHLILHSELAVETGVSPENCTIAMTGDVVEFNQNKFEVVSQSEENRDLIDVNDGMEITRSILKERRTLAEKGIVFVSIDFHPESFRFISEPEIVTFGLVKEDIDQFMVDELHHRLKEWVEDYSLLFDSGKAREDFDEFLRIHVRRFYFKQLNKKPIVKIIHS